MKAIHNVIPNALCISIVVLYPKDTEKWKQFTTSVGNCHTRLKLFCIPKILKNESNSQRSRLFLNGFAVVLYPKDTEKWKQFTTLLLIHQILMELFCIPKILKNESNSQHEVKLHLSKNCCFVSQRYWKMKAIHNPQGKYQRILKVVLYPKDTEKWKQFTTFFLLWLLNVMLFCIPKILKNESNSQHVEPQDSTPPCCFVSQRYWKMKAIHNHWLVCNALFPVVLYPKDTEKWKQFTTSGMVRINGRMLFCIPKILKNESNSQRV